MKLMLCSAAGLSLVLASCSSMDPDYAEYKKQKEAEAAAAQSPYGQGVDPYGVPGGETGSYAPLQPLPGAYPPVNPEPIPSIGGPANYPSFPEAPAPAAPSGPTTPHVVAKGDTLWGLARRYNTSVDAIKAANGLNDDTIQTGRTIQIPQN